MSQQFEVFNRKSINERFERATLRFKSIKLVPWIDFCWPFFCVTDINQNLNCMLLVKEIYLSK